MRDIAVEAKLPLIVDCAAILPPRQNLTRFTEEGADLVIFSGGKAIRGPNNTGIILGGGRYGKELIGAIRMQSYPAYGIGRPFKVNKESVVGLVTALEIFLSESEEDIYATQLRTAEMLAAAIDGSPEISARVVRNDGHDYEHPISPYVPRVAVEWDAAAAGFDAAGLDRLLAEGDPPIKLRPPRMTQANATSSRCIRLIDTYFLREGDAEILVARIKEAFDRKCHRKESAPRGP
jgi:L-seryl-tRNA(Ser) seleniumtransferase